MGSAFRSPGHTARIARARAVAQHVQGKPAQLALPAQPRGGPARPVASVLGPLVYEEPTKEFRASGCPAPTDPVSGRYLRDREGKFLDPHDWRPVKPGWLQCRRCGWWTEVRP